MQRVLERSCRGFSQRATKEEWARNMTFGAPARPGTLFVVPTPIGNPRDITLRALDVLKEVPLVLAENPRAAHRLLAAHDLGPPPAEEEDEWSDSSEERGAGGRGDQPPVARRRIVSCHEHNAPSRLPRLLGHLAAGRSAALISDAGTPGISDPGSALVWAVRAAGLNVTALPGPCAAVTALSASGWDVHGHYVDRGIRSGAPLSTGFTFLGFLPPPRESTGGPPPPGPSPRQLLVSSIAAHRGSTFVFYEAPSRVRASLRELAEACEGQEGGGGAGGAPPAVPPPLTPTGERKARRAAAFAARSAAALPGLTLPPSTPSDVHPPVRRPVFLARELSKAHEQTTQYGSLWEAAAAVDKDARADGSGGRPGVPALGEFTLLLGPCMEV